jgi:FkbM family methyltransferase
MKYSIVIPTYNLCEKYLKPCIDSIIKYSDMNEVELIVSANGCVDNTKAYLIYLKTAIPNLSIAWEANPLGFAKAINAGIKLATTDKIILLNNDTILLEQEKNTWLNYLSDPFEDEKCGITCVIKNYSYEAKREFAVFFCVMIHRKVFDKLGLLSEEYGVGAGEDMEFSIETENAGFSVIEVCSKKMGEGQWVSQFPIFHVAEGTVHDPSLVQNWDAIFQENTQKIAVKYGIGDVQDSLKWICENGDQATAFYNEIIRDNGYRVDKQKLKNREVIDIGANMGTFSIFAAKLGAKKVISAEPSSKIMAIFRSNIERANITNIVAKQNAVLDRTDRTVKLSLYDHSGYNNTYKQTENFEEVKSITLKDMLSETTTDNIFLKIDCEGGEYDILLHADKKDMDKIGDISLEIHTEIHPTYKGLDLIENKLTEFGFKRLEKRQVGQWDGIDKDGKYINYIDLPVLQEIWTR